MSGHAYRCVLPGRHQIENTRTAILTCRHLNIPELTIQIGVNTVIWPGRLEFVSHDPDFVLDGAHNPAGAASLASYIREFCARRPVWLVYGAMRDKAIDEVTEQLFPLATRLILTAPNFPRALRPEAILAMSGDSNATSRQLLPKPSKSRAPLPRKPSSSSPDRCFWSAKHARC